MVGIFVDGNVGAVHLIAVTDVGREAANLQPAVKQVDRQSDESIRPDLLEQRIRAVVAALLNGNPW